jgi:hypothetical protein
MSETAVFHRRNTLLIGPNLWIPFLADFTRTTRGAHAVLRIIAPDNEVGYQVETEDRPFDGVSADNRDGERSVWIAFSSAPGDHFTHGVHNAVAIRSLAAEGTLGPVLEVESADGTRTILELTPPDAYALPSA